MPYCILELKLKLFQRKYKEASKCYQNAMSIDETSIPSLIGLLRCQVIEYDATKQNNASVLHDISDQIEFLEQVQTGPVSLAFFESIFAKPLWLHYLGVATKPTLLSI